MIINRILKFEFKTILFGDKKMYRIIALGLLMLTLNAFADGVEIPVITKSVTTSTAYKFTEKLNKKLPTGYKVKIDLNNGQGLVDMNCSGLTCNLSTNVLPKKTKSASYKVGVYDSKGVLKNNVVDVKYTIVSNTFTEVSNLDDEKLPDSTKLCGHRIWTSPHL
jgi:hypothetical protein